jgi:uncharacterized protein involved in exopolysaccharide biosynthesis
MKNESIFSVAAINSAFSDMAYDLRWPLLRFWNVIYFRRWLVMAVVLVFVLLVVLGCLSLLPTYSATCILRLEPENDGSF